MGEKPLQIPEWAKGRATAGLIVIIVYAVMLIAASGLSAAVAGAALGNLMDPVIAISVGVAILSRGRWYVPIVIMIVGTLIAMLIREDHFHDQNIIAWRTMGGVSVVALGCVLVTIVEVGKRLFGRNQSKDGETA